MRGGNERVSAGELAAVNLLRGYRLTRIIPTILLLRFSHLMSTTVTANRALGVFDSEVGGLTVVRALRDLLPNESIVYLGDTARVPYGLKSPDTIRRFSMEDTQFLVSHRVNAEVVACKTATVHALPSLQATFRVPVIGVLGPCVEATLADAHCERVAIIGGAGTIRSHAYQHEIAMRRPVPSHPVPEPRPEPIRPGPRRRNFSADQLG